MPSLRCDRRTFFGALAGAAVALPVHRLAAACPAPARLLVLPVLHALHAGNHLYGYDAIYAHVAAFAPDLVAVEIRQEDLGRPEPYLRHNYPQEMIRLAALYPDKVVGFDWLGDELAGRAIPDDWWTRQSRIKALERAMDHAPPARSAAIRALDAQLNGLSQRQLAMARTSTASALADGRYDRIAAAYYRLLAVRVRGTAYAPLPLWYDRRNRHIADAIVAIVRRHPGRRIAIVTGADHHGPVVTALAHLGCRAILASVT